LSEVQPNQQDNDWRRDLNRAVRDFASAVSTFEEAALPSAVKTVLREIGEALAIDCGMLIEFSNDAQAPTPVRHWHWSMLDGADPDVDGVALQTLVEHVTLERDPVVVPGRFATGDGERYAEAAEYLRQTPLASVAVIPMGSGRTPVWAWVFGTTRQDHVWPEAVVEHLQVLGEIAAGALQGRQRQSELVAPRALPVTYPARERETSLAPAPTPTAAVSHGFDEIIGDSPSLRTALGRLEEVANTECTVLLLGETGTGKELFARALHARGPRRASPLVTVNCGALPPTLIESELFGHQRGAFTGAVALRQGRFELAHRGTLFLDEIGDLPPEVQVKLLRVLQEGVFERVGSSHSHSVDVRIIAATHRDLTRAVAEEEFRADLYYRLNVFPIRLPPLRERREDIPGLVWSIIRKRQRAIHRQVKTVPADVMDTLKRYSWPGNVRELENVIERALIHSTGDTLTLLDWNPEATETVVGDGTTLKSVERAHIQEVLHECGWKINGFGNAAERLGLHPNTLRFRMKKLGIIRRPSPQDARRLRSLTASEASGRAS